MEKSVVVYQTEIISFIIRLLIDSADSKCWVWWKSIKQFHSFHSQKYQNYCRTIVATVLLFIGLLLGLTIWTFGGKRQFSYYFHWLTNATIICCVFRQIKRTYICADFVCPSVKHFISFGNIVKSSTVNKHLFSKIYIFSMPCSIFHW